MLCAQRTQGSTKDYWSAQEGGQQDRSAEQKTLVGGGFRQDGGKVRFGFISFQLEVCETCNKAAGKKQAWLSMARQELDIWWWRGKLAS